ncbi:unnamed protein product [Toxocara canis]|nr:unnamed protein product [Toxocara canis]
MALPEATKREIVTAFPCVGEIMNSESVKAWMDERDKTQDGR